MSLGPTDNCVCDVVRDIVAAQDEVANNNDNGCCSTGCENSIEQLLSPAGINGTTPVNDTIPFILYCKGECEPFIGSGVYQAQLGGSPNTYFGCVETPIFRAKEFVDDEECCVRLELLLPVTEGGSTPGPGGDDVCDYFPGNSIRDFQATGICITVDLNCFCGITCLDPITPLPASQFPDNDD
ncbi:CotY/CotZ family spore coat protein [Oceanobacillus halotolerans]|uniref:CotY/CotZ family spore coat protein n=1 Tax=Oceanobacillus halotolerans TaxID=2663380 RepID=UPI0013DC0013|nr:CotY/CotZ family spore coat protein [Oceanobacillus halotolerans]